MSLSSQFDGLKSVHYVGDVSRHQSRGVDPREFHGLGRIQNADGVFKMWSPSRSSARMRQDDTFPMDAGSGRIEIPEAGVYFVYAQGWVPFDEN